jgi:hypothetical protein
MNSVTHTPDDVSLLTTLVTAMQHRSAALRYLVAADVRDGRRPR